MCAVLRLSTRLLRSTFSQCPHFCRGLCILWCMNEAPPRMQQRQHEEVNDNVCVVLASAVVCASAFAKARISKTSNVMVLSLLAVPRVEPSTKKKSNQKSIFSKQNTSFHFSCSATVASPCCCAAFPLSQGVQFSPCFCHLYAHGHAFPHLGPSPILFTLKHNL